MCARREGCDAVARTGYPGGIGPIGPIGPILFDLFLLPLDRLSLLLPQLKTAQQSGRVLESVFIEYDHRTGGRVFGGSRTVGHDHFVVREFLQMILNFAGGD